MTWFLDILWKYPKMEGEGKQTDNVGLVKRKSDMQNHERSSTCKRISDGFVKRMENVFVRFVDLFINSNQTHICVIFLPVCCFHEMYECMKSMNINPLYDIRIRQVSVFYNVI